jgi:hypothetical protein
VKLAIGILAGLTACGACTKTSPAPLPPGGPPFSDPTGMVYNELVEAGCLQPDDASDGYAAIYEESVSDQEPRWLSCLYNGLSIAQCGVPCGGGE